MNGIDDFIFNKEFDNVEDLEIEERKNKYTPIEELEEDEQLDVNGQKIDYKPSVENNNEEKVKKGLLTALGAFIVIAWFTWPICLPALLEWISDGLDGPLKTFLLVTISVAFILFTVMFGPSRYGEKDPLKRLVNFILYIFFILIGIVIFAISS